MVVGFPKARRLESDLVTVDVAAGILGDRRLDRLGKVGVDSGERRHRYGADAIIAADDLGLARHLVVIEDVDAGLVAADAADFAAFADDIAQARLEGRRNAVHAADRLLHGRLERHIVREIGHRLDETVTDHR